MTRYEAGERYRVRITDAAIGESKNGNPQVEIGATVIYGVAANGAQVPVAEGRIVAYLPLTEATIGSAAEPGWVVKTLLGLGWQGGSFSALEMLPGIECNATCKHEEYNDQTQEKWALWPERRGPAKAAPPAAVRKLDAQFSGVLKAVKPAQTPTPPARKPPTPTTEQTEPKQKARGRTKAPVYPSRDETPPTTAPGVEIDPATGEEIPF